MPILAFAQGNTFVCIGGIGIATVDNTASHYNFGGGYFFEIKEKVSSNLMIGVSYTANKVIGKAEFPDFNSQSASAISTYFFKPIDTSSKLNIFLKTAGGWMALKSEGETDNTILGLFGGGLTYDFYEGVKLMVEANVTNFGDEGITAFCPSIGVSFPLEL